MGQDSNIEWTHHTFNPWMGCTKVSAGCANCYAENLMDTRYGKVKWGDNGTRVVKKDWSEPRKWNRLAAAAGERHRVFCASLADVFEDRPELIEPRVRLMKLIHATPHLDWLLLTKRPQNIMQAIRACARLIHEHEIDDGTGPILMLNKWIADIPPANVWIGTSIENQATADERIPHLLRVPAAVRFLSVEPLLGPVDLHEAFYRPRLGPNDPYKRRQTMGIDWVIVGGESGAKARSCDVGWIRSIVGQCVGANVPVFVKQLGANARTSSNDDGGGWQFDFTDRKGGDMSEWPEDLRVRELPKGGAA
jgi:protein gp37